MNKPKVTIHFKPPIPIKGNWMIGFTRLEVYNFIFNITEENNKFEFHKFPDEKIGGNSYEKVRDDIEKDLIFSNVTDIVLQDEIFGRNINDEYREQVT